ncbi:Glutamine--fructose-6-phosphate aminotransferase (isomerizing) [Hyella patelloides LEGE 07179]|uniref:Glutamine--fructose-6-phosphate aminotransferase [isomerizing] n=1 Tax=Hyella patelloides LEGE 07179 TaxID=945734 RepID=A0A563W3B2_9CYAN|nr:glutamine--fructose-6-phosphate transaminase (isomerizing) [Hyella patelloides]VEP18166.1 Glutamine--fructose-6-phosphate aminotransferase (isomerizing) [Hyella patelloides LEGE 07179]
MCGIVGYIGTQTAKEILVSGLERLEYRGYDSAGVATISEGKLECVKAKGKLYNLREKLEHSISINDAQIGIGHTRWATHGKPEEHNAHPHLDSNLNVAVVQNGIIENYRELREELKSKGVEFSSETDTEVVPNLISQYLNDSNLSLLDAVQKTIARLEGGFAIAIIDANNPYELIVARQQAPITLGFGQGEFFCASDVTALLPYTRAVLTLENGEIARLTPLGVEIYTFAGKRVNKFPRTLDWNPGQVEKQGFRHYMLKEIHEQPGVVRSSLETYLNPNWHVSENPDFSPINLGLSSQLYENTDYIQIVACGTSWHASLIGKYLLEQLAGIPTTVDYASEYRYSPKPVIPKTLTIGVTQSGETADTIAALEMERARRSKLDSKFQAQLLAITNRPESTIGQICNHIINTQAGIEIGVAATKTFIAQVLGFYYLALDLAYHRKTLSNERISEIIEGLHHIPDSIEKTLETQDKAIEELAHNFTQETEDFIFIGRGINFPIALEGALKLKEISYIHAEAYPAGEMKHGPIALLDHKVPVVAVAMPGSVYEKVISNAQEAKARDARLIGVTSAMNSQEAAHTFNDLLTVPEVEELLSPILAVIPLQLLSYHIAAIKGLDVDQPRNLAKSVTVE